MERLSWSAKLDVEVDEPAVVMDAFVLFAKKLREDPGLGHAFDIRLVDSLGDDVLNLT